MTKLKTNTSNKTRLWYETDVWCIKGEESGKIHARFRIKASATYYKPKMEKQHLEGCEIVFIEKGKEVKK